MENKLNKLKENGTYNKNESNVKSELFKINPFFDSRDLVQVKYEMIRCVEKDGVSVKTASELYGFSRVSFYKIREYFNKYGFEGLFNQKRGPHGSYKLSDEAIEFIYLTQNNTPEISNAEICEIIFSKYNIRVHPRTISRIIKKKLI